MAPKKPKPNPAAPDGLPASRSDRDATSKSAVSEVQDPAISGDAGKAIPGEANEPEVDEAGQIRDDSAAVDLLH
jgi:hypothetical protein